jgi:ABC-type antimicrobial peptide transport system permease subunit
LVEPVRRAIRAVDPALPGFGVSTLDALAREDVSQDRLVARVVSFFGALALVLAALGLYGVLAYATLRRTGEFGLRMALGARAGDVTRLVLREAMTLAVAGVLLGIPAAVAGTRLLRSQLFGVGPLDVPSFVLAVVVLAATAALAGYLPALRASRASPLEALRSE